MCGTAGGAAAGAVQRHAGVLTVPAAVKHAAEQLRRLHSAGSKQQHAKAAAGGSGGGAPRLQLAAQGWAMDQRLILLSILSIVCAGGRRARQGAGGAGARPNSA